MSASLIERVRERLAAEIRPRCGPTWWPPAIRAESGGVLGDTEVLTNLRVLQTELTGAGMLEPLLCAHGTTDVLVTAPDAVWVDDGNGLRRSPVRFADEAAVRRLAQRLALAAGRRLDDAQPWVDGQLTGLGTGRVHGASACGAAAGRGCGNLHVAAGAAARHPGPGGADRGGRDRAGGRRVLRDVIAARLAFLVSGGTGAGKTTLLAALLGAVSSARADRVRGGRAPSWRHRIRIWSSWSPARPTSKAPAKSRCASWSARRCACGRTGSWSARSGAPKSSICWRR